MYQVLATIISQLIFIPISLITFFLLPSMFKLSMIILSFLIIIDLGFTLGFYLGINLEFASKKILRFFLNDELFALQAIEKNMYVEDFMNLFPIHFHHNEQFLVKAIQLNPKIINIVNSPLFNQIDFIQKVLKGRPDLYARFKEKISNISNDHENIEQFMTSFYVDAIKNNYKIIAFFGYHVLLPEIWKSLIDQNSSILTIRLVDNSSLFENLKWESTFSKKELLKLVQKDGLILNGLMDEEKNCKDIVLTAVKQNGLAIKFANKKLQNDPAIIKASCLNNLSSINFLIKEKIKFKHILSYNLFMKEDSGIIICIRKLLMSRKVKVNNAIETDLVCSNIASFLSFSDILSFYKNSINEVNFVKKDVVKESAFYSIFTQNVPL